METNALTLAAFDIGTAWPILQFILGLGLMVFVHELGHFLAAKAVGIKVERFALGFGPRLVGYRGRETDYCINALPLGGYIKMLGQEDFAPLKEDDKPDPRSYNAKSVGARMIVIAAGVVMNAIMALIMFTIIAVIGHEFPAPVLGDIKPHSPAAEAKIKWISGPKGSAEPNTAVGLKTGDYVESIDGPGLMRAVLGPEVTRFDRLYMTSAMSDPGDRYQVTFLREVDGSTWTGVADLGVKMSDDGLLQFGIGPARSTIITREDDNILHSPLDPFRSGDRVIGVAGRKTDRHWDIEPALRDAAGMTVPVKVIRDDREVSLTAPRVIRQKPSVAYLPDGNRIDLQDYDVVAEDGKLTLKSLLDGRKTTVAEDDIDIVMADELVAMLGMTPRVAVGAVMKGTPGEKAGLRPGDVIVHYADTALPTHRQVKDINKNAMKAGKLDLTLRVERDGNELSFKVTPAKKNGTPLIGFIPAPDLAHTVVAHVRPGSPAARAGIESEAVIEKINGRDVSNWADIYAALAASRGKEVTLSMRRSARPDAEAYEAKVSPADSETFRTEDYQLSLFVDPTAGFNEQMMTTVRKEGLGEAIAWSLREATSFTLSTYISIRSLVLGNVSSKQFVGPLGMGGIAVKAAEQSFMQFFYFMAIVSTILAVMNFLPLPVVDGGHAVFLIIEKVRGKPLPVKLMNIVQLIGLVALGLVFLALTYQDITRLFG